MMNATTILCILLLSLYLLLAVFWIVRSIIDTIDDRKREKRNAAWEAERQQLEKGACPARGGISRGSYEGALQIVILIQRVVGAIPPPIFHCSERMCL